MQFTTTMFALAASLALTHAAPAASSLETRNAFGGGVIVYTSTDCSGPELCHINHDQATGDVRWPTGTTGARSIKIKGDGHDVFTWADAIISQDAAQPCGSQWGATSAYRQSSDGWRCVPIQTGATCLIVSSSMTAVGS